VEGVVLSSGRFYDTRTRIPGASLMLGTARVFLLGAVVCTLSGCGGEDATETAVTDRGKLPQAAPNTGPSTQTSAAPARPVPAETVAKQPNATAPAGAPFPGRFPNGPPGAPFPGRFPNGPPGANPQPAGESAFEDAGAAYMRGTLSSADGAGDRRRDDTASRPGPVGQNVAGEPEISFPESFADWTDEDFTRALEVRTVRLGPALMARAEASAKAADFVPLARKLLTKAKPRDALQSPANRSGRPALTGTYDRSRFGSQSGRSRRGGHQLFSGIDADEDEEGYAGRGTKGPPPSQAPMVRPAFAGSGSFTPEPVADNDSAVPGRFPNGPPGAAVPGRFPNGPPGAAVPGRFPNGPPGSAVPGRFPNGPPGSASPAGRFDPGRFQSGTNRPPFAGESGMRNRGVGRRHPGGATAPRRQGGWLSDRAVVQVILRSLLVHDSKDAWATLLSVLKDQQKTPLDLKQSSIVVFEEVFGSERLNTRMATQLAVSVVNFKDPVLPAMELLVFLASRAARVDMRLNDAAEGAHADRPAADTTVRGTIADQAAAFMTGRFPGREEPQNPPAGKTPVSQLTSIYLPTDSIQSIVPLVQSSALTAAVRRRLEEVTDLSSEKFVIALASMLPGAGLRHTTYKVLSAHQKTAAKTLLEAGLYEGIARNPGHLLVLKSMPRLLTDRSGGRNAIPPDPARVSWSKATWKMVNALRKQLKQSSADREIAWAGSLRPRLRPGTTAEAATRLVFGEHLAATGELPAGTQVYYARCKVTPRNEREMKEISDYYKRVSRGIRRERREEGILWFDGIRTTQEGVRTTLDVIIEAAQKTQRAPSGYGAAGNRAGNRNTAGQSGQTYTLETIAVVAADPRNPFQPEETEIFQDLTETEISQDPTETAAPEETAEEAVQVIVNGLSEGNAGVLWAALPSGYQNDVNGLVRTFGNGMDPVQWGQIQGVVAKVHELLSTKSEFIANTSAVQGMVQSDQLQNVITQIAGILKILLDQTDLQSLQSFDGEAFFSGPASTMVSQMDVLSTLSPDGVSLSSLKEAKIKTIRTEGNKATLKIFSPQDDEPEKEVEFVNVDGHWLPAELASDWDSNIAGAKAALAGLPATVKDSAMQVAMVTGMVSSVLDPLQAAEDQEQFDAAVESLLGSMNGMLGPMLGGFGGGPFGADLPPAEN